MTALATTPFNVRTADGTTLAGFAAWHPEPRGTVIIRTPYDCAAHVPQARSWQARGYSAVVADVRGRYRSNGQWHPYASEGEDGCDTVRAVLDSGRHAGRLVLSGASYDAHCALETARRLPPDLGSSLTGVVAAVPALGRYETARNPGGTPRLRDRLGWWYQHGFARTSGPPLPADRLVDLVTVAASEGPTAAHPLTAPTRWQRQLWAELWAARPLPLAARYAQVSAPLLVITGSRDFFVREALHLHRAWSGPAALISGPWGHGLLADLDPTVRRSRTSLGDDIVAWLDAPDHFPSSPPPAALIEVS
ncbi:CocE/NonD family hydrolase [Cryobacterium sp. PH29-G1]|uniref:CocE/NonD family hydrolase n=1 Tax=Cryobacterium sp. PH29-G1 TaxID=3046211 RepID=UPI0024B94F12|nr:CocE/NonD family hydrolase [Cryobacterium sp. PH29-G1]MDJ0350247.1 CocE/NonD family hydrolase [Cryobacterium sp. PH29-G1]